MLAWPAYPAEVSPRHWRNTRPGQHIQQRCHPDIGGMQGLASISSRGVTQTLEEYKAWPAYPAEVSPKHWRNAGPGQHIQQRCHPDIGGIQGLASSVLQDVRPAQIREAFVKLREQQMHAPRRARRTPLEECKAWPAYPAEMSPRHWMNTRPGQHIQQRCHPAIGGILGLASISSRGD